MKIRQGFVSNSSSSSFVISCKPETKLVATMKLKLDDLIDTIITTLTQFEIWITDYSGYTLDEYCDDNYWNEIYTRGKQALERGYVIKIGDASNDNGAISAMIYDTGLHGIKLPSNSEIIMDVQN
jgi:hypothetical protein